MSCIRGKTIELIISAGLRKNFLKSRSMMAKMRWSFMFLRLPLLVQMAHIAANGFGGGIAELPPGVKQEHVVERCALHRDATDVHTPATGQAHQLADRLRP